jgi:hypothetical protein
MLYDLGLLSFEDKPPEKYYSLKIEEIKELFKVYDKVVGELLSTIVFQRNEN